MNDSRPLFYDVFCSAGGCTKGYQMAGFRVVGIDIDPQPRYIGDGFIQMCALEFLNRYLAGEYPEAAALGGSPPCQGYSETARLSSAKGENYPKLIPQVRELFQATGKPYVIENVPGAPLINPIWLTGTMFGLMTQKPRMFECNFDVPFMLAPPPHARQVKMGRKPKAGEYIQVVGHFTDTDYARKAMGIDWMNRHELAEAVPPAYTHYIGEHLMRLLNA